MTSWNGIDTIAAYARHDSENTDTERAQLLTEYQVAREDVFSATAARMSAFNAFSSILSP